MSGAGLGHLVQGGVHQDLVDFAFNKGVRREGKSRRAAAEVELAKMEGDLRDALQAAKSKGVAAGAKAPDGAAS